MNPNEYQNLAEQTECRGVKHVLDVLAGIPQPIRLFHAALGLSTEVGEFNDMLKKWIYYQQELDQTNLEEELGDILWYVALACNALEVSLEDVMEKNIAKLKARYPGKYTDFLAAEENRDRDAERKSLEGN